MTWVIMPFLLAGATLPTAGGAVLVAVESGVEAYAAALEGLGATLRPNSLRVVELRPVGAELTSAVSARDVQVVVAIGSHALAAVNSLHPAAPVIATMVLHDRDEHWSHVELEIPLAAELEAMRGLWPGRHRVGIIRNPARSRFSAEELEAQARKQGFAAVVLDCQGPVSLLRALAGARGKVDFLLCFPDPELYNPVTIRPFILASLEARLPIVGFSPSIVRAGAAAGIYPDYREIGRQTGEMALRGLRGEDLGTEEGPRKIQLAVNQRVARLLGVEFHIDSPAVEVFR